MSSHRHVMFCSMRAADAHFSWCEHLVHMADMKIGLGISWPRPAVISPQASVLPAQNHHHWFGLDSPKLQIIRLTFSPL